MEGTGMSIFQGSDLKFSNSFQRAEEDELEEENRKRDAELKDLFQDAFDDLNDDDDTSSLASSQLSVNQSDHEIKNHNSYSNFVMDFREMPVYQQQTRKEANLETIHERHNESNDSLNARNNDAVKESDVSSKHYSHCFKNGLTRGSDNVLLDSYKKTESGGVNELKVLYEIRMREIERLRREVDVEREAKEEAIHQLALSQMDCRKTASQLTECEQLISKSKDRINELEDSVDKMKAEILELEKAREKDHEEVRISHEQVICLQQKISALERCDASTNRIKQTDAFIESLNSKHQKELTILQNKVDSMMSKLEQKEKEYHGLELKLDEVERKRAALVLEKCDGTARQESALQALLTKANEEKLQLNRQIVSLQTECTGLKSELEQYENVAKLRLCLGSSSDDSGEGGRTGPSQLTRTRSASSLAKNTLINPHHQDIINNLRDELHRALLAKAAKRHEINKLQEQVRSKELQIQEMKERERVYLTQADSLKADITKIVGQLSENKGNDQTKIIDQLRSEIDQLALLNQEHLFTISHLNTEMDKLKNDLKSEYSSKVRQGEDFLGLRETELLQLKSQSDLVLKTKELEWKNKLDHVMKECDEIKQLYMDMRKTNSRLNNQLELQKQQLSLLVNDKEQVLSLLKDKESVIDRLKEENIKYKVEKEINKSNNIEPNLQDKNTIHLLELEIDKLRRELIELPKKQTKELERLKNELETAKSRLIELDNRFRMEFQHEVSKVISERNDMNEKLHPTNACGNKRIYRDISIGTDPIENYEILALKEEINRLKSAANHGVDNIQDDKITAELEELENRLVSEHKAELAATEERIKTILISYYTNNLEEIKKQFEIELDKVIANENKKASELTELLTQKETEIQQLKNCIASDKVAGLQKKFEEDRLRFTETIKHWSNQVQGLKNKITDYENKIQFLNQRLKTEKKDTQKFKAKFDNAKKRIQQEKLENLLKVQADLNNLRDLSDLDEKEINEKIRLVELEFKEKEKSLKLEHKLKKGTV